MLVCSCWNLKQRYLGSLRGSDSPQPLADKGASATCPVPWSYWQPIDSSGIVCYSLGVVLPPTPSITDGKEEPLTLVELLCFYELYLGRAGVHPRTRAAFSQPASHSLTGTLSRFLRKYNFTSSPAAAQTYFPRYSTRLLATGISQSLQPELSSALSVVLIYFQEMKTHHSIICTLSW